MDQGLTMDQVQGLASMLDETNGMSKAAMQRPASQQVGYSLAEGNTSGDVPTSGEGKTENPNAPKHQVSAMQNPGAIYVPDSVKDRNVLPVPSRAKGGSATTGGQRRPKPKGNDIWSMDEVEMEVSSVQQPTAAASSTTTNAVAPTTTAPAPVQKRAAAVDRRISPEYEILYKQVNTAEDVYLSMDFTRDGSTALSCDSLAVKVTLPLLEDVKDIELDVEPLLLTLRTRDYHLKANLPERVLAKKGNAQWDGPRKVLTVIVTVDPSDRKVKVM